MASIFLYDIPLSYVPPFNQHASVEYKVTTDDDSTYIMWDDDVLVLTTGYFSPEIEIEGLSEEIGYSVRITLACGPVFVKEFSYVLSTTTTTSTTTSTTTTMNNNCVDCAEDYDPTPDGRCVKTTEISATPPTDSSLAITKQHVAYSIFGTRIYDDTYSTGGTVVNLSHTTLIPISNLFWINKSFTGAYGSANTTVDGPLNRTGIWVTGTTIEGQIVGFTKCITISSTKTYYIGMGTDNIGKIYIDGILLITQKVSSSDDPSDETLTLQTLYGMDSQVSFKIWHVYPVTLSAGEHIIEVRGMNHTTNSGASVGVEIYDCNAEDLISITNYSDFVIDGYNRLIFSSKDIRGGNIQYGTGGYGYTCPPGYALSTCDGPAVCRKTEYLDCGETP